MSSSNVASHVPVLSGPNYQEWAPKMESFLMSQGQYTILTKARPKEPTPLKTDHDDYDKDLHMTVAADVVEARHEEWEEKVEKLTEINLKALGNIRLRLHHSIAYKCKDEKSAGDLWRFLKSSYRKIGISTLYSEFKQAMDLKIPDNADPSLQIDRFTAHFGWLSEQNVDIDDHIQAMILLAKLPRQWISWPTSFAREPKSWT